MSHSLGNGSNDISLHSLETLKRARNFEATEQSENTVWSAISVNFFYRDIHKFYLLWSKERGACKVENGFTWSAHQYQRDFIIAPVSAPGQGKFSSYMSPNMWKARGFGIWHVLLEKRRESGTPAWYSSIKFLYPPTATKPMQCGYEAIKTQEKNCVSH